MNILHRYEGKNLETLKSQCLEELNVKEEYILEKINQRLVAKQEKNYELADQIRNELLNLGIILKDGKDKTTWDIKQLY